MSSRYSVHNALAVAALVAAALLPGSLHAAGPHRAKAEAPEATEAPAAPAVSSDDAAATPRVIDVEEMVVIGRRAPERAFTSDRATAALSEERLRESSPRTVPEALYETPGVFVQQTNPGAGTPIMRGLMGPQNLILVDGVRLNNSLHRTGPTQYLNLIDPLSLSRIEVLRGPGSVLYGSDAMGGVVDAVPLAPGDYRDRSSVGGRARALLRYGGAAVQRTAHATGEIGWGGTSAIGGVTYTAFGDLRGGRGVDVQPYSGYSHLGVLGNAVHRFQDAGPFADFQLSATYLMAQVTSAGRGHSYYTQGNIRLYDNEDHLAYVRAQGTLVPLSTAVELTASYHRFIERQERRDFDLDKLLLEGIEEETRRTVEAYDAHTVGLDLRLVTDVLAHGLLRLRYGGTWYRDFVGAEEQKRRQAGQAWAGTGQLSYPDGSRYDLYGGFLMIESDPLATAAGHTLRLAGGYRLHGIQGHAPARPRDELPEGSFSHLGHVFSGSVSYLYRDRATVAATFSQGFRAPNLFQAVIFGHTGNFFYVPSSDLGPERSDTVELLGRLNLGPVFFEATGYATFLYDLITRTDGEWNGLSEVDGKPVTRHRNSGRGLIWGVESRAAVRIGGGVSVSGHLTYTWGEEWKDGEPNKPLSRIPPLFGQLTVRYDVPLGGRTRAFAETYLRGALRQDRLAEIDKRDERIPDNGTPAWWTWNLRGGVILFDDLRLTLTVDNLLDRRYKYHGSGIYSAGTNAVLTLEGAL